MKQNSTSFKEVSCAKRSKYSIPFSLTNINIGLVYGILSGFMDALSNSFKKHLGDKIDRFLLISIQMMGTIVVSLILMFYTKTLFVPQISPFIFVIGLLFGFLLMLNNYFMLIGFYNFDLNLGTIVMSSELAFASVFAYLLYKEIPTKNELIAIFFIILSIIVSHISIKRKK